jgi:hypothetical protein
MGEWDLCFKTGCRTLAIAHGLGPNEKGRNQGATKELWGDGEGQG